MTLLLAIFEGVNVSEGIFENKGVHIEFISLYSKLIYYSGI